MKKLVILLVVFFALTHNGFAQTKVSGIVLDNSNQPIPYANIVFKGSNTGVVSNEDGRFYIESPNNYTELIVSFTGFPDKIVKLPKLVNFDFKVILTEGNTLKEVKIFAGKTSKKSNPALDILRKIWERRRKNGLKMFKQYQYEKYEKVEFDMNTIDSAFMKSKIFNGMEFVFKNVDTSSVTGKTYLPIFINESLTDFYGDNENKRSKEILKANKNSGLGSGNGVNMFIKDLYNDYDIYDDYLNLFDKSFTSPLSKTGIDVYNYVLADTAVIDNKLCYNIVFYPRRKNELTFKGDFWVNDTTFAIKKITMAITKSANINWVKDIYIEQEFAYYPDLTNATIDRLTWLVGYWQTPLYFEKYKELLQNELMPAAPIKPKFTEMAAKMHCTESVALGIRLYEESDNPAAHARHAKLKTVEEVNQAIGSMLELRPQA
jgi:hypothetical protein